MEALEYMEGANKSVVGNCKKLIDKIDKLMEDNGKAMMQKVAEDKDLEARVKRIATAKELGNRLLCVSLPRHRDSTSLRTVSSS